LFCRIHFLSDKILKHSVRGSLKHQPGSTNRGERLSTVELLIKVACFVKKENNILKLKNELM
jgi:hypothetical protein